MELTNDPALPVEELCTGTGRRIIPSVTLSILARTGLGRDGRRVARLSAALETVGGRARAPLRVPPAVRACRSRPAGRCAGAADAGHDRVADVVTEVLVGRDVVPGLWTFQIVEAYDATYAEVFRTVERSVRTELGVAAPHLGEAEMKVREQN